MLTSISLDKSSHPALSNASSSFYKIRHSYRDRLKEASVVLEKYPDKIPVICEKSMRGNKNGFSFLQSSTPTIDRNKYLVPNDMTVGQFMHVIRKRLQLPAESAMFLMINDSKIAPCSALLSRVYATDHDTDGFLYFTYSFENTFG